MIRSIVEQHAEEAAFLWLQRNRAARAPHYNLADLCFLDERVEAHLDGLRVAGDMGWEVAREALSWQEPGELFTAATIALDRGDLVGIARVLDETAGDEALLGGFAGALSWVDFAAVERILPGLLSDGVPTALKHAGITACAAHRRDPGPALARALQDRDDGLRAAALRAVGLLGLTGLKRELAEHYSAEHDECRFWAAWSGARFGDDAALPALWAFAEGGGPRAEMACSMALCRLRGGEAVTRLNALRGGNPRLALYGAAVLGDPEQVPWIIEQMSDPELARYAGEAFHVMTGVPIHGELKATPPEEFDGGPSEDAAETNVNMDPDDARSWPNADNVAGWWDRQRADYAAGIRYLLGEPLSDDGLRKALRGASQRTRALVALEMALFADGKPLFAVHAPGFRQARALSGG